MDRVLLGAIFRKLPLKLLLIILAVFAVCFVCFSSAYEIVNLNSVTLTTSNRWYQIDNPNHDNICVINTLGGGAYVGIYSAMEDFDSNITQILSNEMYCSTDSPIVARNNYGPSNITILYFTLNNYTSQQCQTEYNLIPINEIDNAYCESNNLCSSSSSPSDCPNVGVSNLFINDVFHPGAYNVIMNIPEEIDWDYAYTNSGSNINIDVVGYNQDTEYINGLIDVQNYQPTTDDFTKVFTNFGYFGGLLVACLFVILVFYFIKRLFK